MPGLTDTKRKKKIRFKRQDGVALMPDLIAAFDQLADMLGVEIEIEGVERSRVIGGGAKLIKLPTGSTTPPSSEIAFTVRDNYSIVPGLVNTIMPTIGGVRLDHSTPPTLSGIPSSGVRYVFLKMSFTTTFVSGYLSAFSLNQGDVQVEVSSSSSPTNTASVKYLLISTITNGVPSNPYANRSPLPVTLWDNGYDSTTLRVGNL